jgi:hypothetical protein
MKAATLIGVLLIGLGLVGLVARGFSYKTEEKIVDLGPLEASKEEEHAVPTPPAVAGLALAGGIVLVIVGARRT